MEGSHTSYLELRAMDKVQKSSDSETKSMFCTQCERHYLQILQASRNIQVKRISLTNLHIFPPFFLYRHFATDFINECFEMVFLLIQRNDYGHWPQKYKHCYLLSGWLIEFLGIP
jgi:hypothetical protein